MCVCVKAAAVALTWILSELLLCFFQSGQDALSELRSFANDCEAIPHVHHFLSQKDDCLNKMVLWFVDSLRVRECTFSPEQGRIISQG